MSMLSCFELLKTKQIHHIRQKQKPTSPKRSLRTCLELESLGLLPGEALVGEVTVLGGLEVDGLGKVELLDNDTGAEIKVLADDLDELIRRLLRGTVGLDEDGEGLGDTNGVGELDKGTAGKAGVNKGLGDPTADVGSGTVDLGVVLTGEGTTTVGTPATVGVDDDLTAGETGITLRTTDDEAAGRLDVVDGAVVQQLSGDDLLDDLLLDDSAELLSGHIVAVLSRDDNSVHTHGLDGTTVVSVLNSDLGLGVGTEPGDGTVFTSLRHRSVELVREQEGEGQELRGLVGGITEHDTLVTGTELLQSLIVVETLSNVGGLLLNGNKDVAGLVVETLGRVIITDVLDGITDDLLVVQPGIGGDFTKDHYHTWQD
jgi:hypothetical protein